MRLVDRDLIRGGHYGQRSCEPRSEAEHMAAPTNAALLQKVLANPEPSPKIARMAWAMMAKGERYKEPAALAA